MPVLDTTVLIDLMRSPKNPNHARAKHKLTQISGTGAALATTRLNAAELYVGIERSLDRKGEEQRVRDVLRPLIMLDFDEGAARIFGRITASLQHRGLPAGDMDALIAAIALVNGQAILTRNPDHFRHIPTLVVVSY